MDFSLLSPSTHSTGDQWSFSPGDPVRKPVRIHRSPKGRFDEEAKSGVHTKVDERVGGAEGRADT